MLRGGEFYRGAPYQRGYGLGGTFRRFFSWIVPIFKQHAWPVIQDGLKEVGKTAVSTAADIAKDATEGHNLKNSIKERVNNAIDTLKDKVEKKMSGGRKKQKKKSGIKRSDKKKKKYIIIKKKKDQNDIFN